MRAPGPRTIRRRWYVVTGAALAAGILYVSSDQRAARQQFRRLGTDVTSMGGRVQTPPEELASGLVVVTWMFLRPDEAAQ